MKATDTRITSKSQTACPARSAGPLLGRRHERDEGNATYAARVRTAEIVAEMRTADRERSRSRFISAITRDHAAQPAMSPTAQCAWRRARAWSSAAVPCSSGRMRAA